MTRGESAPASVLQIVGLPVVSAALMFGIVYAVNPGRLGVPGALAGGLVIAVAILSGIRLFRSAATARDGHDDSEDTEGDRDT